MMKLKDKIALVTEASGEIGRAICLEFAKEGAVVIIHYNKNKEKAEKLKKQIQEKYSQNCLLSQAY